MIARRLPLETSTHASVKGPTAVVYIGLMVDANEIAQSIIDEIRSNGRRRTRQSQVVRRIRNEYGEAWSYKNRNGNWAIDKSVLKAFAGLKDESIYWDRSDQSWRVVDEDERARIDELAERRRVFREVVKRRQAERAAEQTTSSADG